MFFLFAAAAMDPLAQVTGPGGGFVQGALPRNAYRQRSPYPMGGRGPGGPMIGRGMGPPHPGFMGPPGGRHGHGAPPPQHGFPPHMGMGVRGGPPGPPSHMGMGYGHLGHHGQVMGMPGMGPPPPAGAVQHMHGHGGMPIPPPNPMARILVGSSTSVLRTSHFHNYLPRFNLCGRVHPTLRLAEHNGARLSP